MANQFIKRPFIDNKYTKWYFQIVARAQSRKIGGYSERHHVLPRCLGGSDQSENIVRLTAREHFVVHLLLTKMTNDHTSRRSLTFAFNMMLKNKHGRRYNPSSRFYEQARIMLRNAMTGRVVAEETRKKIGAAHQGKKVTEAARAKMSSAKLGKSVIITKQHASKISISLKGKPKTDAHKEALSKAKKGKRGVPRSEEWKQRIAAAQKRRWEKHREKSAD